MKKLVLASLSTSVLCLLSHPVFADESSNDNGAAIVASSSSVLPSQSHNASAKPLSDDQINYIKNQLSLQDTSKTSIGFYGLLQSNMTAYDTQRSNVPDFAPQHVRLGTKLSGGIASGQVELEWNGNQLDSAQSNSNIDPMTGGTLAASQSTNNTVVIRQGQLNLDAISIVDGDNTYVTTVSFGGIRVGGAQFIVPDISSVPNNFSRQDGAYIQEKLGIGKNLTLNLGFGAFNTLFVHRPDSGAYTGWDTSSAAVAPSLWGANSFKTQLAYVGNMSSTYNMSDTQNFQFNLYAGSQKNAPYSMGSGTTVLSRQDVSHIESSLSYNDTDLLGSKGVISGNGIDFFYEREANARAIDNTTSLNGYLDNSGVSAIYGAGISADSSPYLSSMLQKDDRLTYAIGFNLVTNNNQNQELQPGNITFQNFRVNQTSASIGYAVSQFEVALNGEYSSSDTNIFKDSDNNAVSKEFKSYITAAYVF